MVPLLAKWCLFFPAKFWLKNSILIGVTLRVNWKDWHFNLSRVKITYTNKFSNWKEWIFTLRRAKSEFSCCEDWRVNFHSAKIENLENLLFADWNSLFTVWDFTPISDFHSRWIEMSIISLDLKSHSKKDWLFTLQNLEILKSNMLLFCRFRTDCGDIVTEAHNQQLFFLISSALSNSVHR